MVKIEENDESAHAVREKQTDDDDNKMQKVSNEWEWEDGRENEKWVLECGEEESGDKIRRVESGKGEKQKRAAYQYQYH